MTIKRRNNQIRATKIEKYPTAAAGSVMITMGNTKVLCTASIAEDLPRWLQGKGGEPATQGWVTAEYSMMPGSTPGRKKRGTDSRATEIQRLIARVLRASVDLEKMPGVLITCDCDVVVADGGTRTASITGAFVALSQAISVARDRGMIAKNPILGAVAAVSVGIVDGKGYLDLDYPLDVRAETDMNVAMNHRGEFIEVQGTAEGAPFSRDELDGLLDLASSGIKKLMKEQRRVLK